MIKVYEPNFALSLKYFRVDCIWRITIGDHSSLMIGYFETPAKTRVGITSKNKEIRDRADTYIH